MKSAEIWQELGDTYLNKGDFHRAVDAYVKAIACGSKVGLVYINLAGIFVHQVRFQDAVAYYKMSLQFLTQKKDIASVWSRLGEVYHKMNEHGKAIQAYQKADEIDNGNLVLKLDYSAANGLTVQKVYKDEQQHELPVEEPGLVGREDIGESMKDTEIFKKVMGEDGGKNLMNASAWNELGLVLFKVGAYEDAIDSFLKAIELDAGFGYFYSNLGQVLAAQGRLEEAKSYFEKSVRLLLTERDKAIAWTRIGDIHRQLNQSEESEAAYRLAEALTRSVIVSSSEFRSMNVNLIMHPVDRYRVDQEIESLAASVKRYGIIQPLIVSPSKLDDGKYILIVGNRRLKAATIAGLYEVPVIIRHSSEQEMLELSINENLHGAALNPFEVAQGYLRLANEYELTVEQIAEKVGRSVHSVANAMKAVERISTNVPMRVENPVHSTLTIGPRVQLADESKKLQEVVAMQPNPQESSPVVKRLPEYEQDNLHQSLWYLENNTVVTEQYLEKDPLVERKSLFDRARRMLQGNPRPTREKLEPAYHA